MTKGAILYPSIRCDDRCPHSEYDARPARYRHYVELQRDIVRMEAIELSQL